MVRMRFEPVTSRFFLMIIIYFLSWLKIHKDINFLKSHDQTKFFLILKTNNEKRKNWKKKEVWFMEGSLSSRNCGMFGNCLKSLQNN